MDDLFFKDVYSLFRVFVSALLTYACVVAFVRLAGKRATSQMNNFDWIVTVALGSIVGSTIVMKDLPLLEGLLAISTLLVVQYVVTKVSVIWPAFSSIVRAEPKILVLHGKYIKNAMRKERVTEQEVMGAIREAGIHSMDEVGAVVLETDAKLSVLSLGNASDMCDTPSLQSIKNYEQARQKASSTKTVS